MRCSSFLGTCTVKRKDKDKATHVCLERNVLGPRYSGFRFGPNISPSEFCARPGPKSQAGSGTGRLDLPTKCQQPFSE